MKSAILALLTLLCAEILSAASLFTLDGSKTEALLDGAALRPSSTRNVAVENGALVFQGDARLVYPLAISEKHPLTMEFTLRFLPLDKPVTERTLLPILSLTDSRTIFSVCLVHYPNRKQQLFNVTQFQAGDARPAVCQINEAFEAGRDYRVCLRRGKDALVMALDGVERQRVPCAAPLASSLLTLGTTASKHPCSHLVQGIRIACHEREKQYAAEIPARKYAWFVRNGALELTETAEGLQVRYAGGPAARLVAREKVWPREGEHVRVNGLFQVNRREYGSMMRLSIGRRAQAPIQLMSGDRCHDPQMQVKPIGEPERFDFSVVPGEDSPQEFSLLFFGNPQCITLKGATLLRSEKIVREKRGAPQPEPREYDRAKVDESLAALSPVTYRLDKRGNRMVLLLDGKPAGLAIYRRGPHYPFWTRYGAFRDAGIDLTMLFAHSNKTSKQHELGVNGLWKGHGKYDFSMLAEELRVLHSINPDARVILAASVFPYPDWERDYPEAVFTNAKGERGYGCDTAKVVYYGEGIAKARAARPSSDFTAVPSEASKEWRDEMAAYCFALAKFLQTDPAGKIVCGIHLCSGADTQFFPYDRDVTRGEDHSPAAVRAWGDFLRWKYGTEQRLRTAWEDAQATFAAPVVPGNEERGNTNSGKQTTRRGRDFVEFTSHASANLRLAASRAIKAASGGRLMTGCYAPPASSGNYDLERMADSADVDFFIDIKRNTPSGSYLLRNKLYIGELDLRVPDTSAPLGNYLFDEPLFTYITRFSMGECVLRSGGMFHLFDIGEHYYSKPKWPKLFGRLQRELTDCLDDSLQVAPSLGVFFDYRATMGRTYFCANHLILTVRHATTDLAEHSGLVTQEYFARDALNPALPLPKLLYFPFMPNFTEAEFTALRSRAAKAGSIIIWGYFRPIVQTQTTTLGGFTYRYPVRQDSPRPPLIAANHELTRGLEGKVLGKSYTALTYFHTLIMDYEIPAVLDTLAGDELLARYPDGEPGMILRRCAEDGRIEIANGAPGALSPGFLRNLARQVGAHVLCDNDDVVAFASAGTLAVSCERGGDITIHLPPGMSVQKCVTGHQWSEQDGDLRFHTPLDGDNAIFKLGVVKK
ncbi:MAG: hypothetical protein IJJ33_08390 [Victivallales bacterium]|nr:hypothetical protein [Victivallales bacterium]